jgi:hypothetical protein
MLNVYCGDVRVLKTAGLLMCDRRKAALYACVKHGCLAVP